MRKGIVAVAAVGLLAAGGLTACGEESSPGGTRRPAEDRRDPAGQQDLRPLGERRPQVPRGGLQGRRRRLRHPERPGRQEPVPDHRRPDDHQRGRRADDRQPRLRHRQGRPGPGQVAGHRHHRLRPPHPRRLRRVLRQLRQRQRRRGCRARGSSSASATPVSTSRSWPTSTARRPTTTPPSSTPGYDSVLKPKFDSGEFVKGPEEWVKDWDNAEAAPSSSRCSPRPTARSTACSPPTTASATRRSRS